MNRTERRAAERQANKLANKAASLTSTLIHRSPEAPTQLSTIADPQCEPQPKPELSPARLAANRENALKSTGPKSEQGKFVSSRNHIVHGLARKNRDFQLLPFEDLNEYNMTVADFISEYRPQTDTEVALVHNLAESLWLRNRAQNFQRGVSIKPPAFCSTKRSWPSICAMKRLTTVPSTPPSTHS